jgi:hypothetical protein
MAPQNTGDLINLYLATAFDNNEKMKYEIEIESLH